MKTYTFYIFRETFLPGSATAEEPDVRRVMCEDPEVWARSRCKGNISKIEWDEVPTAQNRVVHPPRSGALR